MINLVPDDEKHKKRIIVFMTGHLTSSGRYATRWIDVSLSTAYVNALDVWRAVLRNYPSIQTQLLEDGADSKHLANPDPHRFFLVTEYQWSGSRLETTMNLAVKMHERLSSA